MACSNLLLRGLQFTSVIKSAFTSKEIVCFMCTAAWLTRGNSLREPSRTGSAAVEQTEGMSYLFFVVALSNNQQIRKELGE